MIDHLPAFIGLPAALLFWSALIVMLVAEGRKKP